MKRVLVVDDDPDVRESLALLLAESYEVATASDGREAMVQLEQATFAAVLLDLMMPVMDGEAVVAEMRARGMTSPVVLASAAPDLRDRAQRLGLPYLPKPFDLAKLEATLATVDSSA